MTQQEFIQKVDADQHWYSAKAKRCRGYHIWFRIFIIVVSATLTILASVEFGGKNLTIAIMSSSIVVITSISELMKFREKWMEYRSTSELIKTEKVLFETNTDPYNKPDGAFNLYVQNHEGIKKSENQKWKGFMVSKG